MSCQMYSHSYVSSLYTTAKMKLNFNKTDSLESIYCYCFEIGDRYFVTRTLIIVSQDDNIFCSPYPLSLLGKELTIVSSLSSSLSLPLSLYFQSLVWHLIINITYEMETHSGSEYIQRLQ